MRKSFAASLAFVAIIAVAVPTTAAPSGKAPRQESTVRERDEAPAFTVIRKFLKKYFGIQIQAQPVIPIPDPETT